MSWQDRTAALIGNEAVQKLGAASVAVFGLGGVGGYTVEALARAGVGRLVLVDSDKVDETNLNRQILATRASIGEDKTCAAARRIFDINPSCKVITHTVFYSYETAEQISLDGIDYIADCIDSVSSKLLLIKTAREKNIPIISCMGTGNKLDPSGLCVSDISKTSVCPLARVMRRELKNIGIEHLTVVYSKEMPVNTSLGRVPASISFVPGAAGLLIAGEIIRNIAGVSAKY